ncbi:hypothetical protein [Mycobacterium riyadhense]|nr:hypothetical protein [Mycobacterium riyadhense]ORW64685.1 hypothetical protein AWC22_03075 [Mycobacterium riyadhense]
MTIHIIGITNRSLRALMTGLLGAGPYTMNQASDDLARLRVNGLITRTPSKNFYTKLHDPAAAFTARRRPAADATIKQGIDVHVAEST